MRKKSLTPLKEIIPHSLRQWGADKKGLLYALNEKWSQIVGRPLSLKTRPLFFRGETLQIGVESSPLANELQFLQDKILAKIREEFPALDIHQVRFQLTSSRQP